MVQCETAEIWDCYWFYLVISLHWWAIFSSEGDAASYYHTASTSKSSYPISAAINISFSASSPHFHMFKFQCTWAQKGLMVNHSLLGRLVGSPVRLEIGYVHSAWVESCRPYQLANRDFKSVEACLEFLRKSGVLVVLSSWDAYFVAYLWNPPLYGNRPSIWKRC